MAALPSHPSKTAHGRGGAGNMGYTSTEIDPSALETPHLKSEMYTTGRGGTGNMARNTDAKEARRAQDVEAPPRKENLLSSTHIGRGGAANVFKPSSEEIAKAREEDAQQEFGVRVSEEKEGNGEYDKGLAEKGKQWLLNKVGGKS